MQSDKVNVSCENEIGDIFELEWKIRINLAEASMGNAVGELLIVNFRMKPILLAFSTGSKT